MHEKATNRRVDFRQVPVLLRVATCALAVLLAGCSENTSTQKAIDVPESHQTVTEVPDAESGERSRITISDSGAKTETNVGYTNGDNGKYRYADDGQTAATFDRVTSDGKPVMHFVYGDDGHTVINGYENWSDGKAKFIYEQDAATRIITRTAYWMGTELKFAVTKTKPDHSSTAVFYRRSGKIFFDRTVDTAGHTLEHAISNDGDVLQERQISNSTSVITKFVNTKKVLRQTFSLKEKLRGADAYEHLLVIEEFADNDLDIKREIKTAKDETIYYRPAESFFHDSEGHAVHRILALTFDSKILKEVVTDSSGAVISHHEYNRNNDDPREVVPFESTYELYKDAAVPEDIWIKAQASSDYPDVP